MKKFVKKPDDRKDLQSRKFFTVLENAYKDWGEKAARVRNYVEHVAPLGGLANSYQITVTNKKQIFDPFLPDVIPGRTQTISKEQLTYNNKGSFTAYVRTTMQNVDVLLQTLLNIEEPLLFKKT